LCFPHCTMVYLQNTTWYELGQFQITLWCKGLNSYHGVFFNKPWYASEQGSAFKLTKHASNPVFVLHEYDTDPPTRKSNYNLPTRFQYVSICFPFLNKKNKFFWNRKKSSFALVDFVLRIHTWTSTWISMRFHDISIWSMDHLTLISFEDIKETFRPLFQGPLDPFDKTLIEQILSEAHLNKSHVSPEISVDKQVHQKSDLSRIRCPLHSRRLISLSLCGVCAPRVRWVSVPTDYLIKCRVFSKHWIWDFQPMYLKKSEIVVSKVYRIKWKVSGH